MEKANIQPASLSAGADPDQLLPLQQAAEETACSVSTLRNLISRGDLPALRFGPRLIRVRRRDLDAVLKPYQGGQAGSWSHLA
jgi:excisionase family DNA binding protein